MQRIYIEYQISGVYTNAFSVKLASVDGTYGIKKQDGTVIVASGTSVLNPSTGIYEYSFEEDENITYTASWEIVPIEGDLPVYSTQTVGPFSLTTSVKAVADMRGEFVQGTTGTLFLSLADIHSNPITASSITVSISNASDVVVTEVSPDFIKSGFYAFDWDVPTTIDPGAYTVTWSYTADGINSVELQSIIVSAPGDSTYAMSQMYGARISDLRTALTQMICCAQKIPVYHEEGIPDADNVKFKFTFPQWNQAYGTRIYRNNKLVENGISINYFRGYVVFDEAVSDFDVIHADYNFRWFSDEDLDRFLSNALHVINSYPAQTHFDLFYLPDNYIAALLYGAAKDAIRELLMCLQFQQPQQVFGGSEAAQKAFSNMETLKKNYEEEFVRLLEIKKFGKYPRIKTVTVPEFTLPGGRSRWFRYMFGGGS